MLSSRNLLLKTSIKKRKQSRKTVSKNANLIPKKPKIESRNQEAVLATPPQFSGEDEEHELIGAEGEDGNFSLKGSARSHSHGVQPLGNLYFSASSINSRNTGLGNLQTLTDELVLEILGLLSGPHLGVLSTVSKSFYVFCNHEPLWRNLVLESCENGFLYNGSWKSTFVSSVHKNSPKIVSCAIKVRDFYSDYLFQSWLCANLEMKPEWLERDNIVRKRGISVEEFVLNFEEPNKPVFWAVQMKLEDYFRYSDQVREERPLYLFDPKFVEKVPKLGLDYEVPEYFKEDLFSVLGNERPDYRWIIIGPAGSGSSFHIDPNSTSAWNAVIRGEVIFVPNGWWHLVINLEDSVAITQNFVSRRNLLNVLDFLKRPNASTLVSGTRDRVNLHDKFKNAIMLSLPGTLDELITKAEEKKREQKKLSFWESVTDSKVGAFKFSF
ncbi:hypothetical protein DH2020_014884 [Rehmannia glutinosa]|uniref:JmjC domain-containing protein n=1 Tax=Rehmannia glutinosa TaxID=99300 RepID=A0ABR0X102_REHGL